MATRTHHGRRASLRWIRRAVLGLVGLLVLGLGAALITLHTDAGRELLRAQIQAGLDQVFVGGASIGRLEGSPFGTLVIRDLVINGPEREPAIQVGRMEVELALVPLVSSEARLERVYAEDVDIIAKRDPDGTYPLARLVRPSDQPSAWSIHLRDLTLERARIAIEASAGGWHHLDDVRLRGTVHAPLGGPLAATVSLRAAWRERGVGLGADAEVARAAGVTRIPALTVLVGGVTIAGQALRLETAPGQAPRITGRLDVRAPAAAVAQLAPGTTPPADVTVAITASAVPPWTRLDLRGELGGTPVTGLLAVDVGARRASGVVATGALDLAVLSRGATRGTAGGVVMLEASLPAGEGAPRVAGMIRAWGEIAGAPATQAQIAVVTAGDLITAVIGAGGGDVRGTAFAEVRRRGDAVDLVRSRLIARTANPARLTGGAAPLRGVLSIDASAAGALTPAADLAVTGRVRGTALRVPGASVASLDLAIDAHQLPRQPLGRAALELRGIVRQDVQLGALTVTAANRPDGRLQVSVRSRPTPAPWLVEVDALVTPPGRGERVIVDVQRHLVRAASAGTWRGSSGHLEIDPRRVTLRDLRSRGLDGTITLEGTLVRAGRRAGDVTARATATGFTLDNVRPGYRGRVDAQVALARTRGRWAGDLALAARGLALAPEAPLVDLDATVGARADQLTVDARLASQGIGVATLVLDVDAPADVADARAWARLHRDVIRDARVTLARVDLGRVAALAGQPGALRGRLDGDLAMSPAAIRGGLHLRDVHALALPTVGQIDADLTLAQRTPRTLTPTLGATLGTVGRLRADGVIELPAHPFDPAAWRALGVQAFGGATVRVSDVALEPGLLDRFGVVTALRGRASVVATVEAGLRQADLVVEVRELRGSPIAEPVIAQVTAAIDDTDAHTHLAIRARGATLLELTGRVPITLAELRRDPRAVWTRPLRLTGSLPSASAPALLGVFGRNEVTAGTIAGTFAVRGTVGAPQVTARLEGTHIVVPPGRNGKPVKTLDRILIDGGWDGRVARLSIDGTQQRGRLRLAAVVEPGALARSTATIEATAFDLAPLLAFAPGPAGGGAGRLDAYVRVTGLDPGSARLAGELHVVDARLPLSPQVGTLRRARVDVVVGARTMTVAVAGKLGRGELAIASTFALAGAMPTSGTAQITLRKVSPIGSVEPVVDADIDATLEREGPLWKAAINVRKGVVRVPKGRGEKLKPIGTPPDMVFRVAGAEVPLGQPTRTVGAPPATPALLARIRIYTLYIEAPEIRGLVKGRLTVSADARKVGVVGTIEADRGMLDLFGRRYALDRASVRFDGSTDPLLDVRISYDFPEVTTITEVTGRLSDPDLVMTSTPRPTRRGSCSGSCSGASRVVSRAAAPASARPRRGRRTSRTRSAATSVRPCRSTSTCCATRRRARPRARRSPSAPG